MAPNTGEYIMTIDDATTWFEDGVGTTEITDLIAGSSTIYGLWGGYCDQSGCFADLINPPTFYLNGGNAICMNNMFMITSSSGMLM